MQPVILCGGSGTRLWPLSREHHPKPLHAVNGERTLLQETALRCDGQPLVVCNDADGNVIHGDTSTPPTRATRSSSRSTACSPASGSTTWWWSRPRMR